MREWMIPCFLLGIVLFAPGCEKNEPYPKATPLVVEFSWEGMKPCGWGNPEIHVEGIPSQTQFLVISMFDHAYKYDHGTVVMPFTGDGNITQDRFKEIQGPCPSWTPGQYKITVKAIDDQEKVLAIGSHQRPFPEND